MGRSDCAFEHGIQTSAAVFHNMYFKETSYELKVRHQIPSLFRAAFKFNGISFKGTNARYILEISFVRFPFREKRREVIPRKVFLSHISCQFCPRPLLSNTSFTPLDTSCKSDFVLTQSSRLF